LRDGDKRGDVHPILDGHQEVQAAAQHVGLVARFAVQGNEAGFERAAPEALFHNSDAVVGDEADAGKQKQQQKGTQKDQKSCQVRHFYS